VDTAARRRLIIVGVKIAEDADEIARTTRK